MTKREILIELLRNYRLVEATLVRSEGGSGENPARMPDAWNPSYRELERCLAVLSRTEPGLARVLLARYVDPQVSRRCLVGRRTSRGDVVFVNQPARTEVRTYAQLPDRGHENEWTTVLASWPEWVHPHQVDKALDQLEQLFQGDPWLPTELLDAA